MKKKNGFTLVEILAAIVILSVIIAILVPVIGNIIDKVKLATLRNNAKALLEAGNIYYAKNMEDIDEPVEFKIFNGVQTGYDKLEFTGKVHTAYLMLLPDNRKAICVDNEKYSATKSVDEEDITIEEGICTGEWDDVTSSYLVSDESGGSFAELSIKSLPNKNALPNSGNTNDIIVITNTKISGYYVSAYAPNDPSNGMVWVVETPRSIYYLEAGNIRIGVSFAMQYEDGTWNLKEAYVFNDNEWKLLYYVDLTDSGINLENSNLGDIELTKEYEYTGDYAEYRVLFPGYYTVELWGAQGGSYGQSGGLGAYTKGDIYLTPGDVLYVYVGSTTNSTSPGYNGGGEGKNYNSQYFGRGGGGATDVRTVSGTWNEGESLKSRIMVAAGGGGSGYANGNDYGSGGPGGGINGLVSQTRNGNGNSSYGTGGTQTMGGYLNNDAGNVHVGGFGYGGTSIGTGYHSTGGGGGGWYGGGAGGYYAGGGGGSSYISGHEGCSSVSNTNGIIHNGSAYSSTGYYFINTRMVDGLGYGWTKVRDNAISYMPTHDGTGIMTGNSGDGYARIKFKTIEVVNSETLKAAGEAFNEYKYTPAGTNLYAGEYQEFVAPVSGLYQVDAYGAQGGSYGQSGGKGAHTKGETYLEAGTRIYIYVGTMPINSTNGGFNGGGEGKNYNSQYFGRGGGGATDIRLTNGEWSDANSLKSRIMVAGGGGGSGYANGNDYGSGGPGGTLEGMISQTRNGNGNSYYGIGGTQSMSGYLSYEPGTTLMGGFGFGGTQVGTGYHSGGGGGGGYYGGGAGGYYAGGGGGSSYISGHEGCSSIDVANTSLPNNILHTGSAFHDSGYFFTNTTMDGNENSGNGYATIKYIGSQRPSKDNTIAFTYQYSGTTLYAGRYQEFIAPVSGLYQVDLYGAQGGSYGQAGGNGAHTKGEIYIERGTKLYLYVGSRPINSTNGGFNGGGEGKNYDSSHVGRGGGGATDIRLTSGEWNDDTSLKSRIMVAGGGGGSGYVNGNDYGSGGPGGMLEGVVSQTRNGNGNSYYGTGGTQSMAGYLSYEPGTTLMGGLGYGGTQVGTGYHSGGGGGGGYYGGGAGGYYAGGGGGSSYISGHEGCSSIDVENSTIPNNIIHTGSAFHDSGYFFTKTNMEAGVNANNGRAVIKLIGETRPSKNDGISYNYLFAGTNKYNGRYQTFTAPKTGNYSIELWGAQGGSYGQSGGLGGYTYGETYIEKDTTLYVFVGSMPINSTNPGWNGGGEGKNYDSTHVGRGGGGATDVRVVYGTWNEINSLRSRIIVAAGGAGSGYVNGNDYGSGGPGGGLIGQVSQTRNGSGNSSYGTGGTQIAGGYLNNAANTLMGGFGYGGTQVNTGYHSGGGGGGGWYGGGSGGYYAGGGGGSSYISGHAGCIGVNSDGTAKTDTYSSIDDSKSYNGYYFTNTRMVDGMGYAWTTSKEAAVSNMPTHDGSAYMTGNAGNGYAKITYLGN